MDISLNNNRLHIILAIFQSVFWLILGAAMGIIFVSDLDTSIKIIMLAIVLFITIVLIVLMAYWISKGNLFQTETINRINQRDKITQRTLEVNSSAQITTSRGMEQRQKTASNIGQAGQIIRKNNNENINVSNKKKEHIKKIALINEVGHILKEWSVEGKTALIIGKSVGNKKVDIDLSDTASADTISKQHAVLNYTGDKWYVDDIDSKNGTRVQKVNKNTILDLKLVGTVEVEPRDIIYISNTRLQLL